MCSVLENEHTVTKEDGWGKGIVTAFAMHIVHVAIFKMDIRDLLYSTGNSAQCYEAAWMAGEFGGD